jgi:acyl-homoserine-lactone acylase
MGYARRTFSQLPRVQGSAVILAALSLAGCGKGDDPARPAPQPKPQFHAEVTRTSYGIAHIRADDFKSLGYGLAYAYAQDNVCMFADSLLTVRGERSRYFGGDQLATAPKNGEYGAASDFMNLRNEDSDFFFRGYLDIDQLRAGYASGSRDARDLLAGYAAGYNRYLRDYAGRLPAACKNAAWVRPISLDDMYLVLAEKALHASGQVFAREIVDGARDGPVTAAPPARSRFARLNTSFLKERLAKLTTEQLGSNALGVGKDLTVTGRGILLGSPHYPWTSTDRFYQVHLTVPGRYDAMGVILGGIPAVVIGFNRDIAWTHTVTTAVHFTTFRLTLDRGDPTGTTYLADGVPVRMTPKTVSVESLQPDGTLRSRSKTFYFSRQGAVIVKADAGVTWSTSAVHVLGDPNRNNTRLIEQWIGIGSARSVAELKGALERTIGLPWVNTVAADRDGQTLFADASVVPNVPTEKFASDCLVLPPLLMFNGSRRECDWSSGHLAPSGIISPANGPWAMRADYVGNSNDSYWLTNPHALMNGPAPFGYSPLYGPTAVEQKLRTRIGFKQFQETLARKARIDLDDVQQLAFANRVYAAELVLPQLLQACQASGDSALMNPCDALAGWDRRADVGSRGAVLFREFWNLAATIPDKWAVPFDPQDPVNTPRGLKPSAMGPMLGALKLAANKLTSLNIPLDGRLGDYQGESRNGVRVPIHGAIGDIDGSYNSIHMRSQLSPQGYRDVEWGTSYIQAVTFDDAGPIARGILLYGQSVDPSSPHYADQLPLYSEKQWPALPFSAERIRADPNYRTSTLSE